MANYEDDEGNLQLQRKPEVVDILEEYEEAIATQYNTSQVIGYAEQKLTWYNNATGGDSMLGNFTAEAMRFYPGSRPRSRSPTHWASARTYHRGTSQ